MSQNKQWMRPPAEQAVHSPVVRNQIIHAQLSKYVTKFRLPPHPCESVPRIWRANIFFDKTGSEMTRI
jgi:hypothetical protein